MIISPFTPFSGEHCESTATGSLLAHHGLSLSEPMIFGLGEGLSFLFWKMKGMNLPFLGGRVKVNELTENLARNLSLTLDVRETASGKKAWENVRTFIDEGRPVGLQLDCYHLEYFSHPFHFGGHYVAMYGYDETHAYVVDTAQQGGAQKTLLTNLANARSEKGQMAPKNRSYTITLPKRIPSLKTALKNAMRANAKAYLSPPITNIAYKGILKLAKQVVTWLDEAPTPEEDLPLVSHLMERAGTGGAIFRTFYRDFLKEAQEYIASAKIREAHTLFSDIAAKWREVGECIRKAGETRDRPHLTQASTILALIADEEKRAMEALATL